MKPNSRITRNIDDIPGKIHMIQTRDIDRTEGYIIRQENTRDIHESYLRYLRNSLAKDFNLSSIPLRFKVETSKNPFVKE